MEKTGRLGARAERRYHHGDLRKAALEAALQHINRDRDVSFTLRELAAGLGVSPTALYRHFDGKLALLAAVAEEGFRELLRRFAAEEHLRDAEPLAFMASRGLAYVQFAVAYPAHFRVMFHPELRQPGQFAVLTELRRQVYARLEDALLVLRDRKLLSSADVGDIALTSWATVHGLAILLVDGQVREKPGKVQAMVRRVLAVQADGFLRNGVVLAAKPAKRARKPGR
jgi:AcrR family transcriptional regulator